MNVNTGGPQILLFERDQQVVTLLTSDLRRAGYQSHPARTAVEVFDMIVRHPVRLVLVNLAQAAAGRREFWVALEAQRRGRGVQVLTYRCTNLAGYGTEDPDERGRLAPADIEVDGMLGVMNLVYAVRVRIPASTTGSPSRVSPPSVIGGQPAGGAGQASMVAPSLAPPVSEPRPAVAPNSALAALASSSTPSPQQPVTTAPPIQHESDSNAAQTHTDWIRAIIYPGQPAWNPPGSHPVNTPGAASALQPTSSESGEKSDLRQLSRMLRMQSIPTQHDVPREVRPEPQERPVTSSGQAGGDVLAPATLTGLPVVEKKVLEKGKSALASELTSRVKVAVHRALRFILSAKPREDTTGLPANKQVLSRYLLPLTIANTIILLVLLILLIIVATRFLSP